MAENEKARCSGRPRGRQFTQDVHVRLPEEVRSRLVSLKAQNDMSFSEIVREALEARLCLAEQSE
jgi:predicted DNA-binding protein